MDKNTLESLRKRASQHFLDSIAVKQEAEKVLPESVARGVLAMVDCLKSGGKVMACGNGGSAADAQHFAAELIGRFEREREELAAIALTTDSSILTAVGNDYSYDDIFSKQVRGLGKKGDILLGISTSGNSKNVVKAIEAAKKMGNKFGFTDRLDYIFVKNGIKVVTSKIIGQSAPFGTDHAGVITELNVTALGSVVSAPLDAHERFPISFWKGVGLLLLALITWRIVRRFRRR